MESTSKQQRDIKAEQQLNKTEEAKGEITVTRNEDGSYTGHSGKQSHTTRATMTWDFLD